MRRGSSVGLVAICSFAVGFATRVFPLSWSPFPTTLDGFLHSRIAREILATNVLELAGTRADQIIEPLALSMSSAITGTAPVYLAQPLYSIIGSVTILIGIVFVRHLGGELGWTRVQLKIAATVVGLILAVDGIFIRRTGTPDSDAFSLVLIPLATLGLFLYVRENRRSWLLISGLLFGILPLTHTFATLIAALGLTALVIGMVFAGFNHKRVVISATAAAGFWVYLFTYYQFAPILGLSVPYVGRISGHPGLFLAWMVALIIGILGFQRSSSITRQTVFLVPIVGLFLLTFVNHWVDIYPGTVQTPTIVLVMVIPLTVPVIVAATAAELLGRRDSIGLVLLALLAAPIVQIGFSLTASLTPEFFATALRAQTFVHLSAAVVVAGGVIFISSRDTGLIERFNDSTVTVVILAFVLVPVIFSLPLAYIDLDTGGFPRGTVPSEFEAASFTTAHVDGPWTSDQKQTRIVGNYFGDSGDMSATLSWLTGGRAPSCTLVSKSSWNEVGAHLFPTGPITISKERHTQTLTRRNLLYSSNGMDSIFISRPPRSSGDTC